MHGGALTISGKSGLAAYHAPQEPEQKAADLASTVRGPAAGGVAVMLVFIAGTIGWAAVAPIAAGAVAPGIISPDGSRRTVQHLEGGIIHEIRARDGDKVEAGQVLVVLENAQAASLQDLLLEQSLTLAASRARLVSEQSGSETITFPSELLTAESAYAQAIVDGQTMLFEQRRKAFRAQLSIIGDRVRQYEEQIGALRAQVESSAEQTKLIEEELVGKLSLYKRGLTTKSEVLRLQRAKAAIQGEHGKALGEISEVQQRIDELATQRVSLEAERSQEIATEMERVRTELSQISERLNANQDILQRTTITAPISGQVVYSRFKTASGVIKPGEPIMDIVPTGEELLIDVRVSPNDIDVVRPGLDAIVHLSAYSSRGVPQIEGRVRTVSADQLVDQATGQSYFLARVEVAAEELESMGEEYMLLPGMPAEVTIVTAQRTVIKYLLEPFLSAFRRGLREV